MEHLEQTIKKYDLEYQRFQNGLKQYKDIINFIILKKNISEIENIFKN